MAKYMEIVGCPVIKIPFSAAQMKLKGACYQKKVDATPSRLKGFTPEFSSMLTPETFPVKGYSARQWRFEIRVYFLLDESRQQEATGSEALVTCLNLCSWSILGAVGDNLHCQKAL